MPSLAMRAGYNHAITPFYKKFVHNKPKNKKNGAFMNDWIARGEGQVTEAPDSPPCDYCGCKPANAVVWEDENGNKSSVIPLCYLKIKQFVHNKPKNKKKFLLTNPVSHPLPGS